MICVSIAESNFDSCLEQVRKYDFIELRLDKAAFTLQQIEKLFSTSKKSIATFRYGLVDETYRLAALKTAIEAGAAMVDMELDTSLEFRDEVVKMARSKGCKIIISHHDFNSTPDSDSLVKILQGCFAKDADIAKIACQVNSEDDNARLLALYSIPGKKVVLGMGDLGRITRIASLYMGAEFSFASPDSGKETASGQLTLKEFIEIQNILNPFSK